MNARILGLVAAGLLAGPMTASAGILVNVNTDAVFSGTFSFTGSEEDTKNSSGELLPTGGSLGDGLYGRRQPPGGEGDEGWIEFGTQSPGTGSGSDFLDPYFFEFFPVRLPIPPLAGTYENPKAGKFTVYWSFSNLNDTGGDVGEFSGAFCFSKGPNCTSGTVPEPGTLALLGLGLAGLAASRRRKR